MKKERVILLLSVLFFSMFVVSLISAQTSQTVVDFTTGTYTCERTATTATWIKSDTNDRFVVGSSPTTCNTYSHPDVSSCCPTSLDHCNTTSGLCQNIPTLTDCTKYSSKGECEADDKKLGLVSISNSSNCGTSSYFSSSTGEMCTNLTRCGCFWSTTNGKSSCSAKKNYTTECSGGGSSHLGTCTWSTFSITNEDCSNSATPISISSRATWTTPSSKPQPADCSDITRSYPCVSTAQLPFFTLSSFIISLASVVFVYLFLLHFNKR